jgi:hypothetical protein
MSKNGSRPAADKTKPRRSGPTLKEQEAELLAFCLGDYRSRGQGREVHCRAEQDGGPTVLTSLLVDIIIAPKKHK